MDTLYRCEECDIVEKIENLSSGCPNCGATMVPVMPLATFFMKVELGNAAMQTPDDLARALELVAVQVRNRMEYPLPVVDANGNTCGKWEIVPGKFYWDDESFLESLE